jgi:endonuclease-3
MNRATGPARERAPKKKALKKKALKKKAPKKKASKKKAPNKKASGQKASKARALKGEGSKRTALETPEAMKARAAMILGILRREFPDAVTALRHENPFQLLIATILSAQCTDERVNMVTPGLFAAYPGPAEFARASQPDIETIIRSTGFFRNKAKSILACSAALMERHGGHVPDRIEELVTLPGVGRKTANVVLGQAFGIASGVVVDTHVQRLAGRLGFSTQNTPEKIEADLMEVFPASDWIDLSSVLILHGRRWCNARRPQCAGCPVRALCPSADSFGA